MSRITSTVMALAHDVAEVLRDCPRMTQQDLQEHFAAATSTMQLALRHGRATGLFDARSENRVIWWASHACIAEMAAQSKARNRRRINALRAARKRRAADRRDREPIRERESAADRPKQILVKAGTRPQPLTKAPRSVFELGLV